jgi:hypothetical protein
MIIPHSLDRGRAGNANTNQAMTEGKAAAAGLTWPRDGFSQAGLIFHQGIGNAAGRGGQKPDSDMVVTAGSGDVDQSGRRQFERGQRGERE